MPLIRGRRGQSTVELALTLPVLLLLVLGIVDFGRVFIAANVITHATRDAARYGSLNSGTAPANLTTIQDRVIDEGKRSSVTIDRSTITISYLDGATGDPMGCYVRGATVQTQAGTGDADCPGPFLVSRSFPFTPLPGDLVQVTVHLPWSAETTIIQDVLPSGFTVNASAASVIEQ